MLRPSFSPSCSDQVPGYIKRYDEFKSKGVEDVYVVAINDMFVMQAWRKKLLSENEKEGQEKSSVKFGKLHCPR
jgi:2-Cys peroxiredoxin 5